MADRMDVPITDAGRRLAEAHDEARRRGAESCWIAVKLADGSWNNDIYDTRADACRHNDDMHHALLQVQPIAMPPAEATHWLDLMRRINASGFKLTDPGQPAPIPAMAPRPVMAQPGSGLALPPAFGRLIAPHLEPLNRADRRRHRGQ